MTHRIRASAGTVPASSLAAMALFAAAIAGPIVVFALAMRLLAG